ncbi:MAG TPA: hypothetical protein GXZ76_07070 [Clostridiaceae bacterium]|nr:hypothetical protein [Clostridiaceae bacterium]
MYIANKFFTVIKRTDIYFMLLAVVAWFNFLQLSIIGIRTNILLKPFLFISVLRELYCACISYDKDKNFFKNLFDYVCQLLGFKPFPNERGLNRSSEIILRATRFLYVFLVCSTIIHVIRVRSLARHTVIQIIIFYFVLLCICRNNGKTKEERSSTVLQEMELVSKAISLISIVIGVVQILMLITNYQKISGNAIIGVYGKGLYGIMGNSNSVGISAGIVIGFSIYNFLKTNQRWKRILYLFNVIIHILQAVFCNARTTLIALFIALFFALMYILLSGIRKNMLIFVLLVSTMLLTSVLDVFVKPVIQENYLKEHLDIEKIKYDLPEMFAEFDLEDRKAAIEELEKAESESSFVYMSDHKIFGKEYPLSVRDIFLQNPFLIVLDDYSTGRIQLWKEATLLFGSNMINGYGFYKMNTAFWQRVSHHGNTVYMGISSSHNLIFDLLWMGGVIGFIIGLLIILVSYSRFFKRFILQIRISRKKTSVDGNSKNKEFFLLLFIAFFIGMVQLFEISAITAFNLSTVVFWLFIRWNAILPQPQKR